MDLLKKRNMLEGSVDDTSMCFWLLSAFTYFLLAILQKGSIWKLFSKLLLNDITSCTAKNPYKEQLKNIFLTFHKLANLYHGCVILSRLFRPSDFGFFHINIFLSNITITFEFI